MQNGEGIEELAERLEGELERLGVRWSEVADIDRSAVINRIELNAPGVARLLCPQLRRFEAYTGQGARSGTHKESQGLCP